MNYKKKLSCILAIVLVVAVMPVSAGAAYFSDTTNHWAKVYIDYVVDYLGIMNGTGNNQFSPNNPILKRDFVTVLGRAWGVNVNDYGSTYNNPFIDVPENKYYTPYVKWANSLGIVTGSGGYFYPTSTVKREDMAHYFRHFFSSSAITPSTNYSYSGFVDYSSISYSRRQDVISMVRAGLIACPSGGTGYFYPNNDLTRAQMATLLYYFYTRYCDQAMYSQQLTPALRVEMTNSFRTEFSSNPDSKLATFWYHVKQPFQKRWGIQFSVIRANASSLPEDECQLPYSSPCIDYFCDSHSDHHKNISRYLRYAENHYNPDKDKMLFIVSSAEFCNTSTTHTGILGLSYCPGYTAVGKMRDDYTYSATPLVGNVRIIQHELSHNYGVASDNDPSHNTCTPHSLCIMTGGFDQQETMDLQNIWCPACQQQFNRGIHQ